MSQEAIMIAVDNSDYMYNGDYAPSRHQAQIDAFNYFCNAKKRMNVENTCGLVTLANNKVICTLTTDVSKLHSKITLVELCGNINFCVTVRVAQLALRHRQSRNQKPRIVVFVGSPLIEANDEELVKLAKKLKKEKVAIDVVSFGETDDNQEKLSNFIDVVNGKDGGNSHLVTIPPGASLQESLRTSPILMSEEALANGAAGVSNGVSGFGAEEMDDPDLIYALRVSLEDQRMQQERGTNQEETRAVSAHAGDNSEEAMLREAMTMSTDDVNGMTEDEQIAYALRMSLEDELSNSNPTQMDVGDHEEAAEQEGVENQEKFDVVDNPELIDDVLEQMDQDNNAETGDKPSNNDKI